MSFLVNIDQFDGPLDLMLHLIKENKLDLFDLNLDVLATQYILYIHQMEDIHLEIASEYLIELTSLIEYKSKKLLPREKVEVEEEYEEDTREKLVKRLIEYQKYKEISLTLREEFEIRQHRFSRPAASLVEEWQRPVEETTLQNQSPYELMRAMNRVLQRMTILKPYETKITIKEISVEDRLETIKNRLQCIKEPVSFEDICNDCANLHMVIVSFLAILDLIHQKWLNFSIDENKKIWVMKGEA